MTNSADDTATSNHNVDLPGAVETDQTTPSLADAAAVSNTPGKLHNQAMQHLDSEFDHANKIPFGMNRFVLLVIIVIYAVCIGPNFFNWTEWEKILQNAGAYSELCPSDDTCAAQEDKIAGLLSLCTLLMFAFTFVAGMVLDVIGPKVCCIFGNTLLMLGWFMLSLADKTRNTYAAGFALLGAGTDPAFFGTLSVANLFPGKTSTIIAVLGAARSISNALPVLLRLINQSAPGFGFHQMALFFLGMYILCLIAVLFLIPRRPYHVPPTGLPLESLSVFEMAVVGAAPASHLCQEEVIEHQLELQSPSADRGGMWRDFVDQCKALWFGITSPVYYPIVFVNIINMIRNNFYLASASKQIGSATTALSIINILAFIPGPIMGMLVDRFGPLKVITGLNTTNMMVFVVLLIGQLVKNTTVVSVMNYASTIFALPGIGFLLSQIYCYVSCTFRPEDMGKLSGCASFIAGICALVVNPMYSWSNDRESFWEMDLVNILLSVINYGFIFFLVWKLSRPKSSSSSSPTSSR